MKRIVVVGAGRMARVRAKALRDSGAAEICGVASRRRESAEKFAKEMQVKGYFDDYQKLKDLRPDALLVEVPHQAQDEIVLWALEAGLNVLIGGSLAGSVETGKRIEVLAGAKKLVVEGGYEARYAACWESAKHLMAAGELGDMVSVRSLALWDGDPASWYYHQEPSGGMPLTHMTYCFINPIRWILGRAVKVSAFANRKSQTGPEMITEETCTANVLFENEVLCTLTAGFVKPADYPAWSVTFFGTRGILEVFPDEQGAGGSLKLYRGSRLEPKDFSASPNAFNRQAQAFLGSLSGPNTCRNTPQDAGEDLKIARAIVDSAQNYCTLQLT